MSERFLIAFYLVGYTFLLINTRVHSLQPSIFCPRYPAEGQGTFRGNLQPGDSETLDRVQPVTGHNPGHTHSHT